jgi:4-carboxymuconolactone decarboxylase
LPATLPLDKAADDKRADMVEENFGNVAPGVVKYTSEALFWDLWLRPGLAPRDRSMVTVSALVASGQVAQVTYHLGRAMDNGLSEKEAGEMLTQLAFYAGWPNVFSIMPVLRTCLPSATRLLWPSDSLLQLSQGNPHAIKTRRLAAICQRP